MIESSLRSQELVSGLIEVLSTSINHERLDDAEAVLACVRGLRPRLVELDTFDAWIALKRGHFADAIRILRTVEANAPQFALAKSLLAFCLFATGDAAWITSANDVMESSDHPDAIGLVQLLLHPERATAAPGVVTADAPSTASATPAEFTQDTNYLRG